MGNPESRPESSLSNFEKVERGKELLISFATANGLTLDEVRRKKRVSNKGAKIRRAIESFIEFADENPDLNFGIKDLQAILRVSRPTISNYRKRINEQRGTPHV